MERFIVLMIVCVLITCMGCVCTAQHPVKTEASEIVKSRPTKGGDHPEGWWQDSEGIWRDQDGCVNGFFCPSNDEICENKCICPPECP